MRSVVTNNAAALVRGAFAVCLLSGWAVSALAGEACNAPDAKGTRACSANMDDARVREIAVTQEKSQWCWAASISMIFAAHGFRLPQEAIVKDVHGKVEDVNAPSGEAMTRALRRHWRNPANQEFAVTARAGDIAANRYEVSNNAIAEELADGRPLLIGTRGHAMVLVSANYERRINGDVVITGGNVIDPLPGKGLRKLAKGEMVLSYVASVQVASIDLDASTVQAQARTSEADAQHAALSASFNGPAYAGPHLTAGSRLAAITAR